MARRSRPLWNSYVAGVLLGLVLLIAFVVTGHGLGVTGATTSITAVVAGDVAPAAVKRNDYLSPYLKGGLDTWIVWEVFGIAIGALIASIFGRRFNVHLDGPRRVTGLARIAVVLGGGVASGFGARMALGCTSGMGLSGAATLSAAGFLFLAGFFAVGLAAGWFTKELWV